MHRLKTDDKTQNAVTILEHHFDIPLKDNMHYMLFIKDKE